MFIALVIALLAGCGDGSGLLDENSLHVEPVRNRTPPCLSYTIDGTPSTVCPATPTPTPGR